MYVPASFAKGDVAAGIIADYKTGVWTEKKENAFIRRNYSVDKF